MQIGQIEGMNVALGAPEDWTAETHGQCGVLPVRREVLDGLPKMTSAWFPTAEEIQRLASGAPIYLGVVGSGHPVVSLGVGPVDHGDRRMC